jgi:membrane-associated phospholipid phosphatase
VESVQTAGSRLVPGGTVRPVLVISALCAVVLTVLGVVFSHHRSGSAFDDWVYWAVYKQFVGQRGLLEAMLVPTEPVLLIVVIGLVVMLAIARGRARLAILAVTGPLVTVGLNSLVLKPLIGRTINNGSLAFPSGHTAGLVSVLTVLVLAAVTGVRPPWRKSLMALVILGAVVLTVIAAAALVGMKYHYVTDAVGGACVAVLTVLLVALLIDRLAERRGRTTAQRKHPVTSGVAL